MNPQAPEPDPLAMDRRQFFQRAVARAISGLESAVKTSSDQVIQAFKEKGQGGDTPSFLRPPGALAEMEFTQTCSRCGDCVRACPAECIQLEPGVAGGLPHIVARVSPCVVCDDLSCMKVCPTGALKLVEKIHIHMGLAKVDHDRCLRRPNVAAGTDDPAGGRAGEDCRLCVADCPLGEGAIGIAGDGPVEVRAGCVGCGICERVCPTEPASIVVIPAFAADDGTAGQVLPAS